VKPTYKTTEGVALDRERGLKVRMVENKLANTPELPVSASEPAVKIDPMKLAKAAAAAEPPQKPKIEKPVDLSD